MTSGHAAYQWMYKPAVACHERPAILSLASKGPQQECSSLCHLNPQLTAAARSEFPGSIGSHRCSPLQVPTQANTKCIPQVLTPVLLKLSLLLKATALSHCPCTLDCACCTAPHVPAHANTKHTPPTLQQEPSDLDLHQTSVPQVLRQVQ